jgi:heme/copper-type cytochrome/quinol oxidase subunit 3
MKTSAIDVSELPEFAFGARDPMFWGVAGLLAIESSMIALLVGGYFYVRGKFAPWPPSPIGETARALATAELALLLASWFPAAKLSNAAIRMSLRPARKWLAVLTLLGMGLIVLRVFECRALGFRWDSNAYGSLFWAMVGLHTLHLLGGVGENAVFLALMFKGPIEKKFMVDLHVNGVYWYFVVAGWTVLYATLYLEPLMGG